MNIRITFTEELGENGMGIVVIHNLTLPHQDFAPLGKIWASVKKRLLQLYGVDVTGLFLYEEDLQAIVCSFYLNYGYLKTHGIDERIYTERFQDTFEAQVSIFEEVIESFLTDPENGADAYITLIEAGASKEKIDNLFNRFLASLNLRSYEPEKGKKPTRKKAP